MKQKHYYSNWELVWGIAVCCGGIMVFGYLEHGFNRNSLYGVALFVFVIAYLCISKWQSFITINERILYVKGQRDFGSDEVDIYSILFIARTSVFLLPKWGCQITIFYKDLLGQLQWFSIRESNYSTKTIKSLIFDLIQMNHEIELDEQYINLLKGVYDKNFFRSIPAISSIASIKNYLNIITK